MYCIHCGKENPDQARFCMHCGKTIPIPKPAPQPVTQPPPAEMAAVEPVPAAADEEETLPVGKTETVQITKPAVREGKKSQPAPRQPATRPAPVKRQIAREGCPVCAFPIRPGIRFCEGCGIQLNRIKLKTCKACGYVNRPGTAFCEGCGKPLGVEPWAGEACSSCGYPNRLGVRFCEGCGESVRMQAEAAAKQKKETAAQLRKISFKMVWRYVIPRVLGGSVSGFVVGKLGQWVFQNLL